MRFTPSLVLHHSALVSFAVNFTSTVPHVGIRDTLSDSGLASASWIRVAGASSGNAAFLKTFPSAPNKKAYWANISITAVDNFTIWVNGEPIGASGDISADGWKTARVLQAALFDMSHTVFSVLVSNAGAVDPGLLAAIRVNYTDGSSDTLVSDVTWAATTNIPPDFPMPFDTSHFRPAMVIAPFGSGPWGHSVIVPYSDPNALNFSAHTWIWSTADAVDDGFPGPWDSGKLWLLPALYVNAEYVGKPLSHGYWPFAQKFTVDLSPASNTFTVIAQNIPNPYTDNGEGTCGFIIAIQIQYTDGSSDVLGTDQTWLNGAVPSVSAFLTMADSALVPSAVLGTFGIQPWGMLNGTSNALNAASVPSIPSGIRASASASSSPSVSISATNRPDVPGRDTASPRLAPSSPVIIGGVMVALAVLGVVAFLILWRRKHRNLSLRLRDANVACTPFVADNPSVTNVEGKYANAIPLRNTSQWAVDAPGGVEILPPNYVP